MAVKVPLAIALVVLLLPIALTHAAIDLGRALAFRIRHRGRAYLVASRRAGWYPFIVNNVAPVLPPTTEVLFLDRYGRGRGHPPPRVVRLARSIVWGKKKPYILTVEAKGFRVTPLHELLVPLKHHRTSDEAARRRVAEVLAGPGLD